MSESSTFHVSQGMEVLLPKAGSAYSIPCDEWDDLKRKLNKMATEPWFFHTIGSVLIGCSLTTITTILLGTLDTQEKARIIAWAIAVATGFTGILCWYFARREASMHRELAADIFTHMTLIERRFDRRPPVGSFAALVDESLRAALNPPAIVPAVAAPPKRDT